MTDQPDLLERMYQRMASKGNMRITGKMYLSKTGQTAGGWWLDTWSESGPPYWGFRMHWLENKDKSLKEMGVTFGGIEGAHMNIGGVDTNIEPERKAFIHQTIKEWETDWLKENPI